MSDWLREEGMYYPPMPIPETFDGAKAWHDEVRIEIDRRRVDCCQRIIDMRKALDETATGREIRLLENALFDEFYAETRLAFHIAGQVQDWLVAYSVATAVPAPVIVRLNMENPKQ